MNKNKIILIILILVILSSLAKAISIGISPGRIKLDNMLRGGYAERIVRISTNSNEEITTTLRVKGEISDWLRFEPNNKTFALSSKNPYELKIIAEPLSDTRSDSYSASISFITEKYGDIKGRAGGFVKAGVTLLLDIVVSDEETRACRAGAFDSADIEIDFPLEISLTVMNDGNVRIRPLVSFDIWDQNQENLVMSKEFVTKEILPTTKERITKTFNNDLEIDQYWVNVAVDECGASDLLTFSVVEKGGIVDKGIFERLVNKLWAYVDEPVEIRAVFKNLGPRTVHAKFKGDIRLDNKIVELIEIEEIDVQSQETTNLITYFTPKESGRYIISGRVIYNRKLTFEKASVLNVNYPPIEKKAFLPNIISLLIYIIILITIIFLVRRIIKIKKRIS